MMQKVAMTNIPDALQYLRGLFDRQPFQVLAI